MSLDWPGATARAGPTLHSPSVTRAPTVRTASIASALHAVAVVLIVRHRSVGRLGSGRIECRLCGLGQISRQIADRRRGAWRGIVDEAENEMGGARQPR